ncbi:MAG: malate synthase G, partial [Pseudomonadota bacterium]|nr:malate synthase G [Pseudomonadota bacterium]
MQGYITRGRLQVAEQLDNFINEQALPGTGVDKDTFWQGAETLFEKFIPQNRALLEKREQLQRAIDDYHKAGNPVNGNEYTDFLKSIGYLVEQPSQVSAQTQNVDAEIATMAGPQLVVPINNARYALNAVNARWGSLYDALYGTDVINNEGGAEAGQSYNPVRGAKVVAKAKDYLDSMIPLAKGSHADVTEYKIESGKLAITLVDGDETTLANTEQWQGYQGDISAPSSLLFAHNGLHFEIQLDPTHPIGESDAANVKDVLVEAALTTIMDCEDSVAAVDAEDKTLVYSNWLGLMKGSLSIEMTKGGKQLVRAMHDDRSYQPSKHASQDKLKDGELVLSGRSLMFVRNVGHLMTNNAMLFDGEEVPEGIMDGLVTSLIAKHDLLGNSKFKNSREGSIYIVKPKMHGPEEVAFSNALFGAIEAIIDVPANTLKIGIMDEERRTSINLQACIAEATSRVVFINTGFLDRTGDEIHTSMLAGPFAEKAALKSMAWIKAYETANVAVGLRCGLSGKAQIGKGMWPIPDEMQNMMTAKIGHPKAGANTAWVPSPTAATLHALHYHDVNVFDVQKSLDENFSGLADILTIPLLEDASTLTRESIKREIDNNVQGILGYVV